MQKRHRKKSKCRGYAQQEKLSTITGEVSFDDGSTTVLERSQFGAQERTPRKNHHKRKRLKKRGNRGKKNEKNQKKRSRCITR